MVAETMSSFILSPVLISVALLLYCAIKYYFRDTGYKYPPGPCGIPFFGYSPNLGNEPHELFDKFSKEYGDVFTITIAGRRYVVLNSYECIKEAFITNANSLSHRPEDFNVLANISESKAMPFINGEEWRLQRKVFTSSLKSVGSYNANLESHINETISRMVEEINNVGSKPIDFYSIFANSTINVVSSIVCGEPLATTEPEAAEIILRDSREAFALAPGAYGFLSGIIVKLIANVFSGKERKMAEIRQRQFNIMNRFIQAHKDSFDSDNVRDYIDLCLKEKLKFGENSPEKLWFNDKNLAANIFLLYMAGTDTTSSTMYFATLMMVKHPDVQKRCQNEIDENVGRDSLINFSDRERLPFVEAVINEILRYAVIAVIPQPRCTTDSITLQGFRIPSGTDIIANLWTATRDKKYWGNPTKFDPDNFYEKDIPRDLASLPFSAGKRICPGEHLARMEIFLFFTSLLQKFTFSLPGNESADEKTEPKFNRMLAPFKVIAVPR